MNIPSSSQPAQPSPNNPQPKQSSSWMLLGNDISAWLSQHIFAIVVTGVFVAASILRWIGLALRHIRSNTNGLSLNLQQALPMQPFHGTHMHGSLPQAQTSTSRHDVNVLEQFVHLLESMFFARTPAMLLVCAIALLAVIGIAQTRFGSRRAGFALLFTGIIGSAIGLLACVIVTQSFPEWARLQRIPIILSPMTVILGMTMTISSYESLLWKRRIVLLGYVLAGTGLLFSGNPGDYCTLAVAIIGHITGIVMHHYGIRASRSTTSPSAAATSARTLRASEVSVASDPMAYVPANNSYSQPKTKSRAQWWHGTDYEIRRLFAAIQLILAIGPLIAITSPSHAGILTDLGWFMTADTENITLLNTCMTNTSTTSCLVLSGLHHLTLLSAGIRIILPIVAMIMVAWGLYHGKRLAANVSMAFNAFTGLFAVLSYLVFPSITDIDKHLTFHSVVPTSAALLTTLPPLLVAVAIACNLTHFRNTTARSRIRGGLIALASTLIGISAVYIAFGLANRHAFHPTATFSKLLIDIVHTLLPAGFADHIPAVLRPASSSASILGLVLTSTAWLSIVIVFIVWFRNTAEKNDRDRGQVNALVELGGESMSFMTTWEGNRYWFSPSGRCAVAYRVLYGIALSVTGPFGESHEYERALRGFTHFCEEHSWSPAFYAVHDTQRRQLEDMGFSSIHVGTEMVVIPDEWQTKGKKWQDIRTAINKAKRDGIVDVYTTYDAAGWQVQQQIVDISEQWAQLKALPEMKFTLGGIEELRDPRVTVLYAVDPQGTILGVTSWLPTYREGHVIGWTLDFMRHRTDAPNGIMEFLIARMAERLRDENAANPDEAVAFMSLSAAPLAGMDEHTDAQADNEIIEHALQIVADIMEPAYGFKSLFFFKRKFQPEADPIFLCYPDSAKLAQIALAVVSSYVPDLNASQITEMIKTMRSA